jgi:signal transduction histidine kinase
MMRNLLFSLVLFFVLPTLSVAQIPGEVSCDNGVDIDKVQVLVKKTVAALAKDQTTVLQQINQGDKTWKDGDFYVVVLQGTKVLAHGYMPAMVGQDMSTLPYYGELATAVEHMLAQKNEGCVRYKAPKPSQRGQLEDKVSYVVKFNSNLRVLVGTYLLRK